jgi:hypothetical protein
MKVEKFDFWLLGTTAVVANMYCYCLGMQTKQTN